MLVTKELLMSNNVLDIVSIPIYSGDYINESENLRQEKNWKHHVSISAITLTSWIKILAWQVISPPT